MGEFDPGPPFSQVCRDELLTLRYDANPATSRCACGSRSNRASRSPSPTSGGPRARPRTSRCTRRSRPPATPGTGHPGRRLRRSAHAGHGRLPASLDAAHRGDLARERRSAGPPRRPFERPDLRAVPADPHQRSRWKDKYIHGFTPLAGNFPGQGLGYALMFVGVNIPDLPFPATPENGVSSARMFLSHPSTFITASDPRIFGDDEMIIRDQSTGTDYTPAGLAALFDDAGLPWAIRSPSLHRLRHVRRPGPLPERRRLRREGLRARHARRPRTWRT